MNAGAAPEILFKSLIEKDRGIQGILRHRIYFDMLDDPSQTREPYLVISRVSGRPIGVWDGEQIDFECNLRFQIFDTGDYERSKLLADRIVGLFEGFASQTSIPPIRRTRLSNESHEILLMPTQERIRTITQDYVVVYVRKRDLAG